MGFWDPVTAVGTVVAAAVAACAAWQSKVSASNAEAAAGTANAAALIAEHELYGSWTLPLEIDVQDGTELVTADFPSPYQRVGTLGSRPARTERMPAEARL